MAELYSPERFLRRGRRRMSYFRLDERQVRPQACFRCGQRDHDSREHRGNLSSILLFLHFYEVRRWAQLPEHLPTCFHDR